MRKSPTQKMRDYRGRLKAQGLRPVQLWAHDTRDRRVRERIQEQFRVVCAAPAETDVDGLLDAALEDIEGWTV